jgi:hypothetical protein
MPVSLPAQPAATLAGNPPATIKECGVCGHHDPIPPGIDPGNIRCINVDAMWHATYNELLIRLTTTQGMMESHIATIQRELKGIESTIAAVRQDARQLAVQLGD